MKTARLSIIALLLTSFAVLCFGAGTVVVTEVTYAPLKKIKWAWTSTAGGAADKITSASFTGKVELLTTVPDGTDIPTDNYDLTVTDADGVDVLAGGGANRDTANTEQVLGTSLGAVVVSKITLNVTNAGAAKKGTVYLILR